MRRLSLTQLAGAMILAGLAALAVPLDEARGQIIESPKISYVTPPPSVFISSSHPVVVKAEGLYGAVDCGPMGDWCQYYDYPFYLNSFAVKVNTVSQTSSFTPMDESYQGESCHWNQGDYGTDWYCWRIYQMSGNVALTLGIQNTVRAEVQYDGNPTTVTIQKTVVAHPDTNYAVGVEVNPTTWNDATARLYVKNTGDYQSLYNLSATCTGTWITGCVSYPDTVTIGAGQQTLISVPVERWSPRGTGAKVVLRAELASDTTVWAMDSMSKTLPVIGIPTTVPEPTLFISPQAGMFVTVDTVTLTINVCSDELHEDNPAWRVINVNGVNRVSEFSVSSSPGGEEHPECDMWHTLEGLLELPSGQTDVYVDFITEYGITATGEQTATFMRPPMPRGVSVTTGLGARGYPVSTSGTRSFTIRNEGDTTGVYMLTPTCGGYAAGGSCTTPVNRVRLAPDSVATVDVSFTTASTSGGGGIMLVALDSVASTVRDSSWAEIAPRAATVPAVDVESANAGATASRSDCLAFGIVPGVATECGVLRFTHSLPGVRVFGSERAPTLVYYYDQDNDWANVAVDVTLPPATPTPDSVRTRLYDMTSGTPSTSPVAERTDAGGAGWVGPDGGKRVGLRWLGLGSGPSRILPYRVRVERKQGSTWYTVDESDGELALVRRAMARGWHVVGVEELYAGQPSPTEDVVLWVGGDGSTRRYVATDTSGSVIIYRAPSLAAPDSLLWNTSNSTYERHLASGVVVYFDDAGRQVRTVNRLGHETYFSYVSSSRQLEHIKLEPDTMRFVYTFHYTSSRLDSVSAPRATSTESRTTSLTRSGTWPDRVTGIENALGQTVEIEIGGQWSMPTAWIDRAGTRTDLYAEHGGGHSPTLGQATVRLQKGSQHDIRHTYRTTRGLAADSSLAPLPLDSVYAAYDGPRGDVDDTTRFRLNRYGAPELVVDALGRSTRIERTDTRFPSLVTGVRAPAGLRTTASYTWRGLVDTVRVLDPLGGSSGDAVTTYQWDDKWPKPTVVTGPDGVESRAWYSAATGNTDSTWVGTSSRTVRFGYHTSGVEEGLPASVTVPLAAGPETYDYDWLGNLSQTKSPIGFISLAFGDSLGRTVLTVSPVDSLTSLDSAGVFNTGSMTQLTYDRLNRVTESIQVGRGLRVNKAASSSEPVLLAHTDTLGVRTAYSAQGLPDTVTRWYTVPGHTARTSLTTHWVYDLAGRVESEIDPSGSGTTTYAYDPAGNVIQSTLAGSQTVFARYDALNRLVRREVPLGTAGGTDWCTWFTITCYFSFPTLEGISGVCTRADTLSYAYDLAGNMTRADSYAARIGRSYNRAGMITGETTQLRNYYTHALDQPCDTPNSDVVTPSAFPSQTYVLQYTYDVSGRRTSLKLPLELTGSAAQQYRYSPTTGELTGITAPSGDTIHFTYDHQGRLARTLYPGNVTDSLFYDGDSRLRARKTGTALGTDHFSRDAAGRIRAVSVGQGESWGYTAESWYGPMGAVVAANNITWNPEADVTGGIEEFETDALGNRTWQRQRNLYPNGPDRNGIRAMTYSQGRLTGVSAISSDTLYPNFGYEQQIDHDAAGNTTISHTQRSEGSGGTEQVFLSSRSYYDPLGRLVVTNTHDGIHEATGPGGVWEEYRYDALGRRVLVRSRRLAGSTPQPGGAGTPWSYTERTVWDGDRIVAELRGDGSVGATLTEVESIGTGGIVQNGDAPWGRVQYIHALGSAASGGIDMPVQIERDAVYNDDVIRFTPLTNWRGQVQGAAEAPGSGDVPSVWPAARLTLDGLPAETDSNYFWMGSLANSMTDGSGLQYRRNRYYDPGTGRFTQSDPIGLAGGMNLYGFAGSDPVNFTDPFGLDPCKSKNFLEALQCVGRILAPLDNAGEAVGRFFVEDLERGFHEIEAGNLATGAFLVLSSLPTPGGKGLKATGRTATLIDGMRLRVDDALSAAVDFLGDGYRHVGGGRFLSADGLRAVRMGDNDILGRHAAGPHMNFETLAPNPRKPGKNMVVNNKHIYLDGR